MVQYDDFPPFLVPNGVRRTLPDPSLWPLVCLAERLPSPKVRSSFLCIFSSSRQFLPLRGSRVVPLATNLFLLSGGSFCVFLTCVELTRIFLPYIRSLSPLVGARTELEVLRFDGNSIGLVPGCLF